MSDVKNKLIKIAFENPELRDELLPLISKLAGDNVKYVTWGQVIEAVGEHNKNEAESIEKAMKNYRHDEKDMLALVEGNKLYHTPYNKNAPQHYKDLDKNIKL